MSDSDFPENLATLLAEFTRSGLREVHIRKGDFELYLSTGAPAVAGARPGAARHASLQPRRAAQSAPQAPARLAEPAKAPDGAAIVAAPNLGTFYRSPKPGAPPFVEIGQRVTVGDELCLIEVMKLFTTLKSDVSGTLAAVLVEDGVMVEAGQPLFAVMAG